MINNITIQGNLTKDPEIRATPSGTTVLKGSLAHNHRYKTREGEAREETTFLDFTLFGPGADTFAQYFFRGDQVLLEGRLKLDTWETQAGEKRSKLNMIADRFHFVGKAGQE